MQENARLPSLPWGLDSAAHYPSELGLDVSDSIVVGPELAVGTLRPWGGVWLGWREINEDVIAWNSRQIYYRRAQPYLGERHLSIMLHYREVLPQTISND